jgi:hypothetical protein
MEEYFDKGIFSWSFIIYVLEIKQEEYWEIHLSMMQYL